MLTYDCRTSNLKLSNLDLDPKMRAEITGALESVKKDTGKGIWAIANASPDELTEVDNKVKRVSKRLVDRGVRLADVTNDRINILSETDSANNGKKPSSLLARAGKAAAKAAPGVGTVVGTADASVRMAGAVSEDEAYRKSMAELGVMETAFDHHSAYKEATVFAGEETGGNAGAMGAAGAAAVPCGVTGWFWLLCVGGVGYVGGLAGDQGGAYLAEKAFDDLAEKQYEDERRRLKEYYEKLYRDQPRLLKEKANHVEN